MSVQITQEMINGAIITQAKYGVPASVTLGQIILESGGSYPGGLSGLAYNDNNLFGIKAGSGWTGETVTYKTKEQGANGLYTTDAKFRKYKTVADSIEDHGKLLSSPIYTNKTAGTTNLNDYVNAMGSVYATDNNYSSKLLKIIGDYNLTQYDTGDFTSIVNNKEVTTTVQATPTTTTEKTGVMGFDWSGLISKIALFIVIVLIIVLAVVFFIKAFNINIGGVSKEVLK